MKQMMLKVSDKKDSKRKFDRTTQDSISNWLNAWNDPTKTPAATMCGKSRPVSCFICGMSMDIGFINLHLDTKCLKDVGHHDSHQKSKRTKAKDSIQGIDHPSSSSAAPAAAISPAGGSRGVDDLSSVQFLEQSAVPGLWIVYDFISEDEERCIISNLDRDITPWKHSNFNGHCLSKTFGVKTQFGGSSHSYTGTTEERIVRVNDPTKGEHDVPDYLSTYPERIAELVRCHRRREPGSRLPTVLNSFKPNECNANSYMNAEGHYLTPHFDDRHLSGPILMNLSLGGSSRMTYLKASAGTFTGASHDRVVVDLPPRCLQLVTGDARYKYMHSIRAEDVLSDRRVSVTWRQAGPANGGLIRGLG